ncbi:MAG: hypothetical protein U0746_12095 [Gemmataceae bacterium]
MLRRFCASALAGVAALATTACENAPPPTNGTQAPTVVSSVPEAPANIGDPLYPPKSYPARSAPVGLVNDPIIVRQCQVLLAETQNVPSKNDGKLWYFCTEKLPGEVIADAKDIIPHPRTKIEYRRLREGDTVKKGQLIGIMDDMQADAKVKQQEAALTANKSKKDASVKLEQISLTEMQMYKKLLDGGGTAQEYRRAVAQYEKSIADTAESQGQIIKSQEDLNLAKIILGEHEIRSDINGKVKRFYRKPGEAVKALEPVMAIENQDVLRIEGLMDVQYLDAVQRSSNQKVFIEPAVQDGQIQSFVGHFQPVQSVAVSKDPRKPLIVTASLDNTARVYDRTSQFHKIAWVHKGAVRAVACTGPGADTNLALTGADDGMGRLWDLDTLTNQPLRELKGRHSQPITCAAFAPDGKTCATSDAKEIQLWDVATGELRYRFPPQHKGPIESLQFTPQTKLVSVARDRSICLWNLGEKGAAVESSFEHRSGNVPVLGVAADGSRLLLDIDRTLRVISLPDQRTEAVFQSPSDSGQFATFAQFSPDGRLVLAAGTGDSPLQLWKAPSPGVRGHLFRRLALGPNSQPTCAAFAPDGTFAVTGTNDNRVLVWGMPAKAEIDRELTGTIVFRDPTIDSNDRRVRIWAELTNPEGSRLYAGDTVTMVIPQEGR